MFSGIEHFAIASPNPKRLADWYVSNLEFQIVLEDAGNYFVEAANGALIEIIWSDGDRLVSEIKTPGLRHIAIAVEDFDAAYPLLKQQGVQFVAEPYESNGNKIVFFYDADGNVLHLIQRQKSIVRRLQ